MVSEANSESSGNWVAFSKRANEFINSGELEDRENGYKRKVALTLRRAREALPMGSDELADLVEEGLDSNLIDFRVRDNIRKWMDDFPNDASETLEAIWTEDSMPLEHRIRAFRERFPREVIGGAEGTLLNLASVLLMGLDEERYPPFRIRLANRVYKLTGYDSPGLGADEATLYRHFLGFLDRFNEDCQVHGVKLRHRLDAQSLIWRTQEKEDPFVLPRIGLTQPHSVGPHQNDWKEFVNRVNGFIESGTFEKWVEDKLILGREMADAREAVLEGHEDWIDILGKKGLSEREGHPILWNLRKSLKEWIHRSPEKARDALLQLWSEDTRSVSGRIRAFCARVPNSVASGLGTRVRIASAFLMGLDPENYPPYAPQTFEEAYSQTGFGPPPEEADEADVYAYALNFIDSFLWEAHQHGLQLLHRHGMRTVTWWCLKGAEPLVNLPRIGRRESHSRQCDLQTLSNELLLPFEFLGEIETLLEDKRQIIFQGPPGTGKTYVARALADYLAGGKNRVKLVQFHPSYAYEDFVRGFRPTNTENGMVRFELQDGPLLKVAEDARNDEDSKYILIVDEINRGNLAKVFGELYFLLEYREAKITLQYHLDGEEEFSLPKNLYMIGTMNTADRSIAMVDLALRRRFEFVPFRPDEEPVKSVLRKWLQRHLENGKMAEDMEWVADVVEEANKLLERHRHAAIGPSYFMKDGLNEKVVRRTWKYNVLPYIEELLFGDDGSLDGFNLDRLIQKVRQKQTVVKDGEGAEGKSDEEE